MKRYNINGMQFELRNRTMVSCPRCDYNNGLYEINKLVEYIPKSEPQFHCPACGISFDVAYTDKDKHEIRDFGKLLWMAELEIIRILSSVPNKLKL